MRQRLVLIVCLVVLALPVAACADIYRWVDANGVMHFSNEPPPAGARVVEKTEETPYDAAADRQRVEEERRLRIENRKIDIEEQKAQAVLRERDAQLRLEQERNRRFEETAPPPYSDGYGEDAYLRYGTSYGGGGYYYSPGSGNPNLYKGYYRYNNSLYYKYPPHAWPTPGPPGPGPYPPPGPKPTPLPAKPQDDPRVPAAPQAVAPGVK